MVNTFRLPHCVPHLILALSLPACGGGAQLILRSPIESQCTSAGLHGCSQIAEGATLYADGNAADGERKLAEGLTANSGKAAELKKFADGLALVGSVPGAGQYVAPLQPAILLVRNAAVAAESTATRHEVDQPTATPIGAVDARILRAAESQEAYTLAQQVIESHVKQQPHPQPVSTFWLTAGNTLASTCRFAGMPKMLCLHEVVEAPKIVTDVMVSAACPVDVMVASRVALDFDWLVYAPAGKGAEVHSAALPLGVNHAFTVATGQSTAKGDDVPLDVRCGVTTVWQNPTDSSVRADVSSAKH